MHNFHLRSICLQMEKSSKMLIQFRSMLNFMCVLYFKYYYCRSNLVKPNGAANAYLNIIM